MTTGQQPVGVEPETTNQKSIKADNNVGGVEGAVKSTFNLVTKETNLETLWKSLVYFTIGNGLLSALLAFINYLPLEPGVTGGEMAFYELFGFVLGLAVIYYVIKVQAIGKNKPNWIIVFLVLVAIGYVYSVTEFLGSVNLGVYHMPKGMGAVLVAYDQFVSDLIELLITFRIMVVLKNQ